YCGRKHTADPRRRSADESEAGAPGRHGDPRSRQADLQPDAPGGRAFTAAARKADAPPRTTTAGPLGAARAATGDSIEPSGPAPGRNPPGTAISGCCATRQASSAPGGTP